MFAFGASVIDDLLPQLRRAGYKITAARREIVNALTCPPLTAQEIAERLRQRQVKSDLVTVYRTLELLTTLGLVRKTSFHGATARYEPIAGHEHHHHLVCEQCGAVAEMPLDDGHLIEFVERESKFKVRRHALEFFGTCVRCQGGDL